MPHSAENSLGMMCKFHFYDKKGDGVIITPAAQIIQKWNGTPCIIEHIPIHNVILLLWSSLYLEFTFSIEKCLSEKKES